MMTMQRFHRDAMYVHVCFYVRIYACTHLSLHGRAGETVGDDTLVAASKVQWIAYNNITHTNSIRNIITGN